MTEEETRGMTALARQLEAAIGARDAALAVLSRDAALSALSAMQEMWGASGAVPTAAELLVEQSRVGALAAAAAVVAAASASALAIACGGVQCLCAPEAWRGPGRHSG